MFRRLESIKGCGIFEDFHWNTSVADFERINLIYGANGTGKTSLSRALDGLGGESKGFTKVSIRMSNADKTHDRQSDQAPDDEFDRIFVFCDGYVVRNHDFDGDTEVEAVLTLGERSVEDGKRITELKGLIETGTGELTKSGEASRKADKAIDDEYTTIARGVVTALSRADGEYRSNSNYSKGSVRTRFAESHTAWALLADKDKEAALATVNSDERQTVPIKSYSLTIRTGLREEASAALTMSPVSAVLDTLREHEEASSWVESGRGIHSGLDTCIFCGGALTAERKKQIEQHFSDEVEEAQRTADALIEEIKTAQTSLLDLLGDGAIAGTLFDDLRDSFMTAHAEAKIQARELEKWIKGLRAALEKKRTNVVVRVDHEITEPPVVDGSKIENALKRHNYRVAQHATLVQEAAKLRARIPSRGRHRD
jgi:wobble nucleotide-excising tRNase